MKKERWTLQKHLDRLGWLSLGIHVSSELIDDMVVYGFVNSSIDMIDDSHINMQKKDALLGIVDKNCENQVIANFYMYQVIPWSDGETLHQQRVVSPIYTSLKRLEFEKNINLEQLYIPDLIAHPLYNRIRSKDSHCVTVTERQVAQYKPNKDKIDRWASHNIFIKEGKAYFPIKKDEIILYSFLHQKQPYISDDDIKSIAQNVLALCRYIHKETGNTRFALYSLDELETEVEV